MKWVKTKELFGEQKAGDSSEVTVQLTTKNSEDKFSLWDNVEKKFYNDGDVVTIDGEQKDVTKYIKLTDEQKKRYNRSLKAQRTLIIDGEEVNYDLPLSLEKALMKAITFVESGMKKDPLKYEYKLIRQKTGQQNIDVEYDAMMGEEINSEVQDVEPEIELGLEDDSELELTPLEQKILDAINKKFSSEKIQGAPTEKLVEIFTKKSIDAERAERIVTEKLR